MLLTLFIGDNYKNNDIARCDILFSRILFGISYFYPGCSKAIHTLVKTFIL
jgi:hypothetical protein